MHKYTEVQIGYIREIAQGHSYNEITELFNTRFGLDLSFTQIRAALKNRGICNGRGGRFRPGHTPFNKGKKKLWKGGEETQFKKGHVPHTYKPVGTESTRADYVYVKVADPNKWRMKHILIWETAYGPAPQGYAVMFADGNRYNVTLDNLLMVSRRELAVMNKKRLISTDAALTKAGVTVADICMKITTRRKGAKKGTQQ